MRNMNRILVGTMLEVAAERRTLEDFVALLEGAPRSRAGKTAPPHGLYLEGVRYERRRDARGPCRRAWRRRAPSSASLQQLRRRRAGADRQAGADPHRAVRADRVQQALRERCHPAASMPGASTANSSPPSRAATSPARQRAAQAVGDERPARGPRRDARSSVLMPLKSSTSSISSPTARRARRPRRPIASSSARRLREPGQRIACGRARRRASAARSSRACRRSAATPAASSTGRRSTARPAARRPAPRES